MNESLNKYPVLVIKVLWCARMHTHAYMYTYMYMYTPYLHIFLPLVLSPLPLLCPSLPSVASLRPRPHACAAVEVKRAAGQALNTLALQYNNQLTATISSKLDSLCLISSSFCFTSSWTLCACNIMSISAVCQYTWSIPPMCTWQTGSPHIQAPFCKSLLACSWTRIAIVIRVMYVEETKPHRLLQYVCESKRLTEDTSVSCVRRRKWCLWKWLSKISHGRYVCSQLSYL